MAGPGANWSQVPPTWTMNKLANHVSTCLKHFFLTHSTWHKGAARGISVGSFLLQGPQGCRKGPHIMAALPSRVPGDPLWVACPPSRKNLGTSTACGEGREGWSLISWRLHSRPILGARDQLGDGSMMGGSCLGWGWGRRRDQADGASFLGPGHSQKDL